MLVFSVCGLDRLAPQDDASLRAQPVVAVLELLRWVQHHVKPICLKPGEVRACGLAVW